MPPPEVWGPAVWTLFHTLAEKINVNAYPAVFPSLFNMIIKISKFLPCPECSNDASIFLAKVKVSELKTKESLKAMLCIFHNTVNAKKRKPIFSYSNIGVYGKYNLIRVINNFISQYQTKGNMKLLTESFQRQFIIKDFKNWFQKTIKAFSGPISVPTPLPVAIVEEPMEEAVSEPVTSVEEPVSNIEEHVSNIKEPIEVQEQEIPVSNIEEPAIEDSISEPVEESVSNIKEPIEVQEQEIPVSNIEEPAIEDSISEPVEEPILSSSQEQASVEEDISEINDVILDTNIETTQVSKKKNKKNKNKNKK